MDKKKKEGIIKCIAATGAAILFMVVVLCAMEYDKGNEENYDIVCLGDSNFGSNRTETGTVNLLEQKTGKRILNGAFGGSMMQNLYSSKTAYQSALSMHNLAIAICNHNFGVQKSAIKTLERTDYVGYFSATLEELSNVDFNRVEILIIEHCVNDYMMGTPIKNGVDAYDVNTFTGALRNIITMIKEKYTDLRIILVTPAYCAPIKTDGLNYFCDEYAYDVYYLEDYVNAELEVAKEMEVEIIDLYHGMDIHAGNYMDYLHDGLHYNDKGRELVSDIIADYLMGEEK